MSIMSRIKQYKNYRNTISELNGLTDRELSDIGMCRVDIVPMAREVAYRKNK